MEGTTGGHAHEPVLLNEVIEWLQPHLGGTFVDCTLGMGGHSEAILKTSHDTSVIGIDRDPDALRLAEERLSIFENRFQAVHANFANVADVLRERGADKVRGVLADLGVSSLQLDRGERGFSFAQEAPLDMRMDATSGETAADMVNHLDERELADLIFEYGEERGARRVARAIVRQRAQAPITTTKQLADTVVRALRVPGRWRIHPATRTFQALRIAVNQELSALETFIPETIPHLDSGARLVIISFHSLEDRVVKRGFQRESGRCICPDDIRARMPSNYWHAGASSKKAFGSDESDEIVCSVCGAQNRVKVLTRKPVRPSQTEIDRNPRSRSARLRVCERL